MKLMAIKLCQFCGEEVKCHRRLFCSDRCQQNAYDTLKKEEEFIAREVELVKKIVEITGNKAMILEQYHQNLIKEVQLEVMGYKK